MTERLFETNPYIREFEARVLQNWTGRHFFRRAADSRETGDLLARQW